MARDKVVIRDQIIPSADECIYTSCYCEENVWKLCEYVRNNAPEELGTYYVIFISNNERMVPLWCQKAATGEDGFVIWDYHVILIHQNEMASFVYDLDTVLPFPCKFEKYSVNSFRSDEKLDSEYHRMFRVIPAAVFLQTFASDRSHMKSKHGQWLKPPPSYCCIQTNNSSNNLSSFISMDDTTCVGQILTLEQLIERFSKTSNDNSPR